MGARTRLPRLVGRGPEAAALRAALDRVCSGRSAIVLIEGEAGIGKTRLLDDALADAQARAIPVVSGRAAELERTRPFGLIADVLGCSRPNVASADPQRMAIAALLSPPGDADLGPVTVTSDAGLQYRVVDAFTDLVEQLALSGPFVMGVDDLQWADPSSLLTLGAIARRTSDLPVALLGCYRPLPRSEDLARLTSGLSAAGARQLTVGPLDNSAVRDLVSEILAAEPGAGLLAQVAGASGNPLFITELLDALARDGAIRTAGAHADSATATLPPTLRLTILHRVSYLSDDTLAVLRAASILGTRFSLADLATITDRSALQLSAALIQALAARVVEEDGDRLRFRHDLIRDAFYDELPVSVRRGLHREAGQRLARAGAAPLQVAEHLARGAATGDAEAIDWLTRAAREAAARSPHIAADLIGRAVELMSPADPGRDTLLAERANDLMWAGRIPDALVVCRSLLDRQHDPAVDGQVRICLGHALLAQGRVRDALRELERIGASIPSETEYAAARAWAGFARFSLGDLSGAAAASEAARTAAAAAGDHQTASIARSTLATVAQFRGDPQRALEIVDEAVELADQSPNRVGHRYPVHVVRGHILLQLDRLADATSAFGTGMRVSDELGVRWPLATCHTYLAVAHLLAGDWDDAIAEAEASLVLAEETGEAYSSVHANSVVALISVHRNDLLRAREATRIALRHLDQTGARYGAQWARWAHALLLEADGSAADAYAALVSIWDTSSPLGLALEHPMLGADLVRLALVSGDRARAEVVTAAVAAIAERAQVCSWQAAALRCRGLVDDDPETLGSAAALCADGPRMLEQALAYEDAGAAFARRAAVDRARPLLERALDIYGRLDAARDIARVEAVARSAGMPRGRRGPRRRPSSGWRSLTDTERAVAALVAEGLSNPEIGARLFISRRTVQTHLGHAFAKLDIASRAQLATEVTRRRHGG